jgi:hypothetical protein
LERENEEGFCQKTEARNGVEKKKKRKSWFWSKKWNQF